MQPSEEPQASIRPSSCGLKHKLLMDAECSTELYTCQHQRQVQKLFGGSFKQLLRLGCAHLRPGSGLGLLPYDHPTVKATRCQQPAKLGMCPADLPHRALMPVQLCLGRALVCYVKHLQKRGHWPQWMTLGVVPTAATYAFLELEFGDACPVVLTLIVLSEEQVAMRRP